MHTLYGFPKTRSFRIVWALEELGVEYDYKVVNLYAGEHKRPDFLAISPTGKVPVLKTEDGVFAESAAILAYLAQKHGGALLPNKDLSLFGRAAEMQLFVSCELEQPLWNIAKHTFALPEDKRVEDAKVTARWEYSQALAVFSKMLGDRQFAAGDEFTYADILAAHTLNWAKGAKATCEYDNINQYHARVLARESFAKATEIEAAKLAELK